VAFFGFMSVTKLARAGIGLHWEVVIRIPILIAILIPIDCVAENGRSGCHTGKTNPVFPDLADILSMQDLEQAVWIPSLSDRSNHASGLMKLLWPQTLAFSLLPHPSQIHSAATLNPFR